MLGRTGVAIMSCVVAAGILASAAPLRAQSTTADTAAPLAVVRELFDAMRAGDSARVRAVFHPQAGALMTADVGRDGQPRVQATPIDGFVKVIGAPHPAMFDERITNPRVQVDGALAAVWVDYAFYLGPKFSHCGIDAFQLARVGATWRIIALADTRRTTGCTG